MPELPEVTTIIGILKPYIVGEKIKNVEVLYERMILSPLEEFKSKLKEQTITDLTRKGKFLVFHLTNGLILISHLRMEGKYTFTNEEDKNPPHTNVVFHFADNNKLIYFDTRKFGIMILTTSDRYLTEKPLSELGPEPMDINESNIEKVYKKLNRKKPIKELITDQNIIAGIGNIYADEILFETKINPLTLGSQLTKKQFDSIISSASNILKEAIMQGGSTIKSYHPKEGVDGKFQVFLKAYGHKGEPCPTCGTPFHKIFLNGRGTTFCPNCQIDYSLQNAIGITGPIGAGKSLACKFLSENGYLVIDSDKLVHQLYQEPDVIKMISSNLGSSVLTQDGKINYKKLREIITNDENKQKLLESLIHPLVENELEEIVKNNNNAVIEVPLLFKAHLQYLFKKIIYIYADNKTLLSHLEERHYSNPQLIIDTYYRNNPMIKKENVVYIDNSNLSIEEFRAKILEVVNQ